MGIWNGFPGKGAGLDRKSYPDLSLGDLPNIYPYHMTITGEGIQAKRRSAACLVDHLPAPLAEAGVYDELAEIGKDDGRVCPFYADTTGKCRLFGADDQRTCRKKPN